MNASWAGLLLVVAAGATGIAVWAGPNLAIAGVGAAVAVLAAGLLFVGAWLDRPSRRPAPAALAPDPDLLRHRFGLRPGRFAREEVITTLDRIERSGATPDLPHRSTNEITELAQLSRSEFSEYVRRRLDELEAET